MRALIFSVRGAAIIAPARAAMIVLSFIIKYYVLLARSSLFMRSIVSQPG